jgi:hypothetical protein
LLSVRNTARPRRVRASSSRSVKTASTVFLKENRTKSRGCEDLRPLFCCLANVPSKYQHPLKPTHFRRFWLDVFSLIVPFMNRNPIKLIWFIDRSEILTLLDDGLSMRKTAGKLGVSFYTVQRVKMENLTCFGSMDY